MPRPKRSRWKNERRWLRQVANEAHDAADWTPEKLADVQERLKRIMLTSLGCDEEDLDAINFGMTAVGILVDIEGARQEFELQVLALRRLHQRYRVTVRHVDADGNVIREEPVRGW